MRLEQIHGHTYATELIEKNGWALDIGCNDFVVTRHFLSLGLKVISIDPLKLEIPIDLLQNDNFYYLNKACVGKKVQETATYYDYLGTGANSLYNTPSMLHRKLNSGHSKNPLRGAYEVELITIAEIMKDFDISQFEIIKCDAEGAEYDILENLPLDCSRQLSIEFHDFLCLTPGITNSEYYNCENQNYWNNPQVISYHENLLNKLENYILSFTTPQRDDTLYVLNKK